MTALRITPHFELGSRRALRMVERNLLVYKHGWLMLLSGFFEPLFYLLGIGFGLGSIIETVEIRRGFEIPFAAFVAPGLLAMSTMNGAIAETIFNVFFKLNYERTYEGILATPLGIREIALGELIWSLFRGTLYAGAFVGVMVAMGLRCGSVLHSRSPVLTWVPWKARVLPLKNRSVRSCGFHMLRSPTCGPSIETMRKNWPAWTRKVRASRGGTTSSPIFSSRERARS